jgi:DNA repair protein RecO (recombination protein O)
LRTVTTAALLLRTVAYGESDVIATLFTEAEGKLGVMVRGGRKSTKRVGGALEPFHTLEARIDDRGGELATLREARIVKVRAGIVESLEAIDAAGMALRWVRHVCPPRTREPEAWETLGELLDALDASRGAGAPRVALARAGLRLLADVGYALDLQRCIQCGKACPEQRSSRVDPARGGLVCSACGGARVGRSAAPLESGRTGGHLVLSADLRAKALAAARADDAPSMTAADADALLAVVDAAMAAHAGFDR